MNTTEAESFTIFFNLESISPFFSLLIAINLFYYFYNKKRPKAEIGTSQSEVKSRREIKLFKALVVFDLMSYRLYENEILSNTVILQQTSDE